MSVRSEAVASTAGPARALGAAGVAGGVLFAVASVWHESSDSAAVDVLFIVAMAGIVALGVGLFLARPGGQRAAATLFPALLAVAWAALLAGTVLEALTSLTEDDDPLNPIGGLLQAVALIGLGITTAVAGRWSSWRRWTPAALAVVHLGAVMVPSFATGEPPTWAVVVWALGYAALGLALVTESSRGGQPLTAA